jgi:ABC transporter substrate binding protein/integrase-like protein
LRFAGAATVWPLATFAQQKVYRIGALLLGIAYADSFQKALKEELGKSGYIEETHFVLEVRSAEGRLDLLPKLAAELVALKVDVIVAIYTPCVFAARQATSTIPIVAVAGDLLESGLVPSLARPGGNITGISMMGAASHGKCVEVFREMLPTVSRIAALSNPGDPFSKPFLEQMMLAGRTVSEARGGIGRYLGLYNHRRPHSSLDGRTPDDAYFGHDSMPPIRLAA